MDAQEAQDAQKAQKLKEQETQCLSLSFDARYVCTYHEQCVETLVVVFGGTLLRC